jgi:ATPase involved in DNA replication initiation
VQGVTQLVRAIRQGTSHPSILLIGATGCGKSRLVQEAENRVQRIGMAVQRIACRELFDAQEEFEEEANRAPRDLIEFDDEEGSHGSADLSQVPFLILEDLPFLPPQSTSRLTQLLDRRSQLELPTLITSVQSPSEIEHLPSRLLGRLASFLVITIPPLSRSSRLLFLQQTYRDKHFLTDEAQNWLAERARSIRELIALPDQLEVLKSLAPPPWDVSFLKESFDPGSNRKQPSLESIVIRVAEKYSLRWRDLLGKSRVRTIVQARHLAIVIARRKGYPLKEIGNYFGGRDHKSIAHAVERIHQKIQEDPDLERLLRDLSDVNE